jgi:type II secretory pathway component PulC
MKKSSEMDVVKTFVAATVIPVLVFACVILKVVLSQATNQDFTVVQVLRQPEQDSGTQEWAPEHILAASPPVTESSVNRQKQFFAASESADTVEDRPELNLLLISVFPGSPQDAMALIKDLKSNSVGIYKTSQQIGTSRIASIRKNRVVVIDQGRRFILKPAFGRSESVNMPEDAAPVAVQTTKRIPIGSPPVAETYEDYQTPLASLKSVLSCAKLEPFSLNGRVQGLKLSALNNILVVNEMDIREGDVIHRINGHLLINKQQAWQVLKKAKSQGTIDVEVLYND